MSNKNVFKNVATFIRYIILNLLSYSDLKNLSLTNKECLELCRDDNYWKNRTRCKLGAVPESANEGECKKWYINNVNDVYYLQDDEKIHSLRSLHLLLKNAKNVKHVNLGGWHSDGYFAIDSFGNLNYYQNGDFDLQIATNVKTFVADRPMCPEDSYNFDDSGVYYIDDKDNLYMILFHGNHEHKKVGAPVKLAQNVSFAGIWECKYDVFGVLYYISDNVLYEMFMIDIKNPSCITYTSDCNENKSNPSFIIKNIKKLIHVIYKVSTIIFIDTNNDLKIATKYDHESINILAKGVKNAYFKTTKTGKRFENNKFQIYYINMDDNLHKITNIEEFVKPKKPIEMEPKVIFQNDEDYINWTIEMENKGIFENDEDYINCLSLWNKENVSLEHILTKNEELYQKVMETHIELERELIFENVKDYGYFSDSNLRNGGKFSYENILTKNGDLYQRVGDVPFTLVQKNVNKLFKNLNNLSLLFSVVA